MRTAMALLTISLATAPLAQAADHEDHAAHHPDKVTVWAGDPYPLASDPVTGEALPDYAKQVVIQHDGRELRFASQANADAFNKEPGQYLPGVDARIIAAQLPWYPLTTCVVSGEKLGGDMGEPVNFVYKNRLIRFCCASCKKDFLADPGKYLAKIDEAIITRQKPVYPLTTCPVSGDKLGEMGKPVQRIIANHLVEFCCPMCIKQFNENPAKYLKQIDDAKESRKSEGGSGK
ncbi:MAG: hypothetical protein WC058_05835 [Phycisphaeraceae bacterium]